MRGNLAGYPARIPHIVGWILGHVQPRPSELATIAVNPLKPRRRDDRSVQFVARHRALELCVPVAVDRPIG